MSFLYGINFYLFTFLPILVYIISLFKLSLFSTISLWTYVEYMNNNNDDEELV